MKLELIIKDVVSSEYDYEGKKGTSYKAIVDDGSRRGVLVKCTESFFNAYKNNDIKGFYTLDNYGRLDFYK